MNDTTVWCQNGSVTESQRELDDPETIKFSLRIGVLMRLNILPVGVDVLDDPRSNKFCFLNGYWYVATRKASVFSYRTVGDAGPYKLSYIPKR